MFAVQPAAWGKFDERGCDYASNMDHAYRPVSYTHLTLPTICSV